MLLLTVFWQNIKNYSDDNIKLDGLLGVDALQCFHQFKLIQCCGGVAFDTVHCVIPFGNIDSFLTKKQLEFKYLTNTPEENPINVQSSLVNLVLNPPKSNFDPIGSVAKDTQIDEKLDNLFNAEDLGIYSDISENDVTKITEFKNGISFKDEKYHVELPWNEKISDVKSNFYVSSAVLNKVVEDLRAKDLYNAYEQVLMQQLQDNIIEEIPLDNIDINNCVWIPHRPVLKYDPQVTTKIRIVLNCSLKVQNSPSLNEAA